MLKQLSGDLNMSNFHEKLQEGRDGEKALSLALLKYGCTIMPLYQFESNTTPLVLNKTHNYTMMDLYVVKGMNKHNFWIDCKRKTEWVEWAGIIQTGFDMKHYKEYKNFCQEHNVKGYIFFIQTNDITYGGKTFEKGVYYVNVFNQFDRTSSFTKKEKHFELVFWFHSNLKRVPQEFEQIVLIEIEKGK